MKSELKGVVSQDSRCEDPNEVKQFVKVFFSKMF